MALDLRIAIGWLLIAIGLQLAGYGLFSEGAARSLNVFWGSMMLVTGGVFHWVAKRPGGKP